MQVNPRHLVNSWLFANRYAKKLYQIKQGSKFMRLIVPQAVRFS